MPRGILLVFSNPSTPQQRAEFNAWYGGVHLPEFLRIPGVRAARRFELSGSQMPWPGPDPVDGRKFLAAYEIETDDFEALCREIMDTATERNQSDALERDPLPLALLFEQIGEAQTESPPSSGTPGP